MDINIKNSINGKTVLHYVCSWFESQNYCDGLNNNWGLEIYKEKKPIFILPLLFKGIFLLNK